jgi:hypothetical protein
VAPTVYDFREAGTLPARDANGPDPPGPPPPPGAAKWEPYEGFRFTFLLHFTLEEQAALQKVAQMLFDAALEHPRPADCPNRTPRGCSGRCAPFSPNYTTWKGISGRSSMPGDQPGGRDLVRLPERQPIL